MLLCGKVEIVIKIVENDLHIPILSRALWHATELIKLMQHFSLLLQKVHTKQGLSPTGAKTLTSELIA